MPMDLRFPKLHADIDQPAILEGFIESRHWTATQLGKKVQAARISPVT
jgi:hypothetical protein